MVDAERLRVDEADTRGVLWLRWGPYLSERQWGTVPPTGSGRQRGALKRAAARGRTGAAR